MNYVDIVNDYRTKYQDCDIDLSYLNRLAVVKFEMDEHNHISGKCRFGLVYRHRDSESLINEGETWVCELEGNYKSNNQFFGRAVMKVDAAFIYDLRQDQMKLIADTLWENNRGYFDGVLEERYKEEVETLASKKAEEKISEMRQTINDKDKQIETLTERISEMNHEIDNRVAEMEVLNEKIRSLTSEIESHDIRISLMKDTSTSYGNMRPIVKRISADILYSEDFRGRYDVRFSTDRMRMVIVPNDKGRVESRDRMIRLAGLNDLAPFTDIRMVSVESSDNGSMTLMMG